MATPTRKKPRLSASPNSTSLPKELPSFKSLSDDELAHVLGFLPPEDIMRARLSIKLRDFATTLIVPPSDYRVRRYKVMEAMAKSLPHMQQITIDNLGFGQKYADGVDPNEDRVKYTKDHITRDITILKRFKKLRVLELNDAPLNGRYAFLFKLPLLQKLTIVSMDCFKWDVFMLSGLLSLRELHCEGSGVSGNIKDLRILKDTLEKLNMHNCCGIEGDFMTLSDFRRLKMLDLGGASGIIGDVRKIRIDDDFQALEEIHLPKGVIGGKDHEFQFICEVADVMLALHRLRQRIPTISRDCYWKLSSASPEWYDVDEYDQYPVPPFIISFVQAGPRVGWRWLSPSRPRIRLNRARIRVDTQSDRGGSCEVNWLDKEPVRRRSGYTTYIQEMQSIEKEIDFYKGYYRPPTADEYKQLCICKEANTD
mmetsp:Transcript_1303/g.2068  ORF Transcript_1303/g.2068 Transcript_1303/m.2068 type:complete len:424 (-) Transcript_1303:436-1707(-)